MSELWSPESPFPVAFDPAYMDPYDGFPGVMIPNIPAMGYIINTLLGSTLYFQRFRVRQRTLVTKIGFFVDTAATANDNVDVALADASYARLSSSGATASKLNSQGGKTVSLGTAVQLVPKTTYYAAIACGALGGTGAALAFSKISGGSGGGGDAFGSTAGLRLFGYQSSAATVPNPIVPTATFSVAPILTLRTD